MLKNINSLTPDIRIQKDKMDLIITSIYPTLQRTKEQEVRQEISEKLFQIFYKYA